MAEEESLVFGGDEGIFGTHVPDFGTKSHTRRDATLTIFGTNNSLVLPLEVTTKVLEVKTLLAQRIGVDLNQLKFVTKQGSSYRIMLDTDEMSRNCTVKGVSGWEKEKTKYPHPMCIIGAGHYGLRQALSFLKEGIDNVVLFDKLDKVGGRAWVVNANPTSKLQTELGVYHLQYDLDYVAPTGLGTWPSRGDLLEHFNDVSVEYGIMPHVQLNTAVTAVLREMDDPTLPFYSPGRQHFAVKLRPNLDGRKKIDEQEALFSTISFFPGGLVEPTRLLFKGEDLFMGQISYGMFDGFVYQHVRTHMVAIVGFGAFAVENVRTCLEHGARKTWIVCRRKNLTMPRVVSWFVNQSVFPPPAATLLTTMQRMYDLIPDDAWGHYAVNANSDRTICNIKQKARFGISDIFFLASYYKKLEVVVDEVKRLKTNFIMLESGDKLDANHIIKVLGFKGDFTVDKIMGIKEMLGYFVNGDWSRTVMAESPGIDATKFGGTSFSPKGLQDCEFTSWCVNYPKDLTALLESNMLPRKKADKDGSAPAYVWEPRAAGGISITISGGLVPGLAEQTARYNGLNRSKMLQLHPVDRFVDECAEEWLGYGKLLKEEWDKRPFPPYPYSQDFVRELCERNDQEGKDDAIRQLARRGG